MGYRSEVSLSLYERDFKQMVKKAKEENDDALYLLKNAEIFRKSETDHVPVIILHWDWVKWYEDYPEVRFIENFIHEQNIIFRFIRIGEDYDDIEVEESENFDETVFYAAEIVRCIDIAGDAQDASQYIDEQ